MKGMIGLSGTLKLLVRPHGDLGAVLRDFYHFVICHILLTCKKSLRASTIARALGYFRKIKF